MKSCRSMILVMLLPLVLSTCGRSSLQRPAAPGLAAEVVFTSGDVQGQRQGAWSSLVVGAKLMQGDSVKVGAASECQLRMAGMAVMSIRENTRVSLDSLSLSGNGSQVKIGLEAGTLLSKVRKLTGTDSYSVRTLTAVGGVRGTEFGVTVTAQGGTLIAVKDGTVTVLPAAFDPEALRALAAASVPELEQVARDVVASAPAVRGGQELTVTAEEAAKAETVFQVIQVASAQIAQEQQVMAARQGSSTSTAPSAAPPPASVVTERMKTIQEAAALLPSLAGTPRALTPVHVQDLKALDALPSLSGT
jgi:hypothetical protein